MEQFERTIQQNAQEGGAGSLDSSKSLEINASHVIDVASVNNCANSFYKLQLTSDGL